MPLCMPQIAHGLSRAQTRAFAVKQYLVEDINYEASHYAVSPASRNFHPLRSKYCCQYHNVYVQRSTCITIGIWDWRFNFFFLVLCVYTECARSRGSSVSIVPDYGMDDWAIMVRSPVEAEDFSSGVCVETNCRAHPASYPMGTGGPFPGGKERTGRDADHSPPSSAVVKNE
jgi:hypothetical protein